MCRNKETYKAQSNAEYFSDVRASKHIRKSACVFRCYSCENVEYARVDYA